MMATPKPPIATMPRIPVAIPRYAVGLLKTPFSITVPIIRNADERMTMAYTTSRREVSIADA